MIMSNKKGLFALSPLIVFISLYLVTSMIAGDFYKVPISVAFMLSSIYAVAACTGVTLKERIDTFSKGAGTKGIMLMIWVFILAGAFAASAKTIGSIDATVNMMLSILPENMILPGIFLATCFVSMSIGTSVGCIVALVPIAAGLATTTGSNIPMFVAVVVGGAFFGDNLSFISDTTIVATSTQGCKMSDKFKTNSFIAFPAAAISFVLYAIIGSDISAPQQIPATDYIKILPYIIVIITAVCGMNVLVVMTIGIVITGIIGMTEGIFDIYGWFGTMGDGILGMSELIIITMLAGGLFEIVKRNGGIEYIISKTTARINGKRGAEAIIAMLVSFVDICTANNTVAIITVGGIARQISGKYGIDNRRAACLLDTFSCMMQGIIPYGAQMLMAAGLSHLVPTRIMMYSFYPVILGFVAALAILFRFPKTYTK